MAPRFPDLRSRAYRGIVEDYRATHGGISPSQACVAAPYKATRWERLGKMEWIEYVTAKRFDGDDKPALYEHEFGEDGARNKPVLFRSIGAAEPEYLILGGGYSVEDGGITDDLDDRRRAPSGKVITYRPKHPARMAGMGRMESIDLVNGRRISFTRANYTLAYTRGRGADQLWIKRVKCSRAKARS